MLLISKFLSLPTGADRIFTERILRFLERVDKEKIVSGEKTGRYWHSNKRENQRRPQI
jgi:hypothetical protein